MAPTKARDRYAVSVLSLPNVVMGRLSPIYDYVHADDSPNYESISSFPIKKVSLADLLPDRQSLDDPPAWLKLLKSMR
jgi:hypothetical protein